MSELLVISMLLLWSLGTFYMVKANGGDEK